MDAASLRAAAFAAFSRAHEAVTDMRLAWRETSQGPVFHRLLECARDERSLRLLTKVPELEEGQREARLRSKARVLRDVTDQYDTEADFLSYNACVAHGCTQTS